MAGWGLPLLEGTIHHTPVRFPHVLGPRLTTWDVDPPPMSPDAETCSSKLKSRRGAKSGITTFTLASIPSVLGMIPNGFPPPPSTIPSE